MEPKLIVDNCIHFRHLTNEQLRLLYISSDNNLPSVLFELNVEKDNLKVTIHEKHNRKLG